MWIYDDFTEYIDKLLELAIKNDPTISAIINEEVGRIKKIYPESYCNFSPLKM
jgi:hypothetical protein